MPKISACLVVRNEQDVIARCLENIKDVVDEIIVLHDGDCDDKTLEICKAFGARVFTKPFVGFADLYRPVAVSLARNNWVLAIDADELLSEELKTELPRLVSQKKFCGFNILFIHFYLNKKPLAHVLGKDYHIRLFRKDRARYDNIGWAIAKVDGKVKRIDKPFLHKPLYDNFTLEVFRKKHLKLAKLHALYGNKDKPRICYLFDAFYHFFRKIVYYWFIKLGFLDGIVGLKVGLVIAGYHFAVNVYKFKYYDTKKIVP